MAETRAAAAGYRSPRFALQAKPGMPLLFDNFAVCPVCPGVRPMSERDETVWRDHARAALRFAAGHVFTDAGALWDVVPRG